MRERPREARFAAKTSVQSLIGRKIAVHDLERDIAFDAELVRAVHAADCARTDQRFDAKGPGDSLPQIRVRTAVERAEGECAAVAGAENHALGIALPTA